MWHLTNSSENSFIKRSKLASFQVTTWSIVAKLINRYLPNFFFLIRNQAFRYSLSESFRTSLLKQSYTIFITSEINAWGSKKFGTCYILCKIVFKITKGKTSL